MINITAIAIVSIALNSAGINTAHNIDYIQFLEVDGWRVRADFGTPRFSDQTFGGFANCYYQPVVFCRTDLGEEFKNFCFAHEIEHIKQCKKFTDTHSNGWFVATLEDEKEASMAGSKAIGEGWSE